jgi:hypothetical protein
MTQFFVWSFWGFARNGRGGGLRPRLCRMLRQAVGRDSTEHGKHESDE